MKNNKIRALIVIAFSLLVTTAIVLATDNYTTKLFGISSIAVCALVAFSIQWLMFIPAAIFQTERYYDLTGSLTFIGLTGIALWAAKPLSLYEYMLAAMIIIWASRLGSFLFIRILRDGSDQRFAEIKPDKYRFFSAWTLQGLWVFLTSCAVISAIVSTNQTPVGAISLLGMVIWLLGITIEIVADRQKSRFRKLSANRHKFISCGLWGYSRHPNYFGEILLWIGAAIAAIPALTGWQYAVLISPLFVTLLLTKISGVPLLEEKAEKKWANDQDYIHYKESTHVLLPFLHNKR